MKIKSGGGLNSRQVSHVRETKSEPVSKAVSPAGVNQMGVATQFRKEPVISGKGYSPAEMPATGIKGTFNSASQGPGSGRTVYGSGSQSPTPQAKPMPEGRNTLAEYGNDIPGRR
jgi:hypothetical protein